MATTERERPTLADLTLVDADSHVDEGLEDLMPYVERDHPGVTRFLEGASSLRREIYTSTRATPAFNQIEGDGVRGDHLVHDASSPEKKIELMGKFDIDFTILTPGINLNLASVNHDQTAVALASAYNSWLVDTYLDVHDGFRATLLVPSQKPDRAAEEIDRLADENGIVGVQLPATGLVPPAGHHTYDPIYEAAEDHGLPVVMHTGNSGAWSTFPVQRTWAETFAEDHAFTFPVEGMWHLISLVFNAVPARFDLDFVIQEAGVEWLPWMMWRLDDHYLQNSQDVPGLDRMPSDHIEEQFTFTTQPLGHTENVKHLSWVLEAAGAPDTVMFATDHPHPDFDPPEELFAPIRSHFDDDAVARMMGGTAADVFGLA